MQFAAAAVFAGQSSPEHQLKVRTFSSVLTNANPVPSPFQGGMWVEGKPSVLPDPPRPFPPPTIFILLSLCPESQPTFQLVPEVGWYRYTLL